MAALPPSASWPLLPAHSRLCPRLLAPPRAAEPVVRSAGGTACSWVLPALLLQAALDGSMQAKR